MNAPKIHSPQRESTVWPHPTGLTTPRLRRGFLSLYFRTLILILAVRSAGGLLAQQDFHLIRTVDPALFAQTYSKRHYSLPDGFRARNIYQIVRGPLGFYWIGTESGLFRFDGIDFVEIPAPIVGTAFRRPVTHVILDSKDRLWIGGEEGCLRLPLEDAPLETNPSLPRTKILSLESGLDGDVWIGTEEGLYRVQDSTVSHWSVRDGLVDPQVTAIVQSQLGQVWVGTREGAQVLNPVRGTIGKNTRPEKPYRVEGSPNAHEFAARDLFITKSGEIFGLFGYWPTPSAALNQFVAGTWRRVLADGKGIEGHELVQDALDSQQFWVTGSASCQSVHLTTRYVRKVRPNGLLSSHFTQTLFRPSNEQLLLGGVDDGLQLYQQRRFQQWEGSTHFREGDMIRSVARGQSGELLIGADSRVYRIRDHLITNDGKDDEVQKNVIRAVLRTDDGTEWKGTKNGLFRNQDNTGLWQVVPLPRHFIGQPVNVLFEDSSNRLWIGTPKGAIVLAKDAVVRILTGDQGLTGTDIRAVVEDSQGQIWLGTFDAGVELISSAGQPISHFAEADGLPSHRVQSLAAGPGGELWVGSQEGLALIQAGKIHPLPEFVDLQPTVNTVHLDGHGLLWLGLPDGLLTVPSENLLNWIRGAPESFSTHFIGKSEGLSVGGFQGEYGQPTVATLSDRSLWFAAENGVVEVYRDAVEKWREQSVPSPRIKSLIADGQSLLSDRHQFFHQNAEYARVGTVRLLEVSFEAPTLVNPQSIQFQTRLKGHDSEWLELGSRRELRYTNLRPGRYELQTRTHTPYATQLSPIHRTPLHIQPTLAQTGWFRATVVILICGGVYGLYRWLVRYVNQIASLEKQAALHQVRERIAGDLHDELGGDLRRLQTLAANMRDKLPNTQQLPEQCDALEAAIHESQKSLRELMWTTSPQTASWENLLAYLAITVERTARENDLGYGLQLPEREIPGEVDGRMRRELGLVVKEAITNILRHADATDIEFHAEYHESKNTVSIRLRDNGRGLPESQPSNALSGSGFSNMRRRVAALGGKLSMTSAATGGVEVLLRLKLEGQK